MAFGIKKQDLIRWKEAVKTGELAFLTHFWIDERFPECRTVTKVGCANKDRLYKWGEKYGLKPEWVHDRDNYPHFDLLGERQREILRNEGYYSQLEKLENRRKG